MMQYHGSTIAVFQMALAYLVHHELESILVITIIVTTAVTCRGRQAHCSDYEMYANSKVKLFMLTAELQRRLHAAGSTTDVFSVHPGEITYL